MEDMGLLCDTRTRKSYALMPRSREPLNCKPDVHGVEMPGTGFFLGDLI